ncbi:ABC transporter ATP-binding protein [Rhodobacteraceae bacterium NNCM2]|nr:ABC transporter ATP-binding protein [Coraliihabitans acroporae]
MVKLTTEGLSVAYSGHPVLSDISITLPPASVTALIGPNGAGKSTLLRAIAGLHPHVGTVAIDGRAADGAARREMTAYMPQDTSATCSLTLLEIVLLGRVRSLGLRLSPGLIAEAEEMLVRFGIAALSGRTLDAVSGGQRQLAFLAQAMFRRPGVLLLDEPTAALDLRHQLVVLETVQQTARQNGIAVVVAMHDLSLAAKFADSFVLIDGGRVCASGPAEAVLTVDKVAEVFGVHSEITRDAEGKPRVHLVKAMQQGGHAL